MRKAKLGYWLAVAAMCITMPLYVVGVGSERFWLAFNLVLSFLAVIQESNNKVHILREGQKK